MPNSTFVYPEQVWPHLSNDFSLDGSSSKIQSRGDPLSLNSSSRDLEMPMPPIALAPLRQHEIR